MGGERLEDVKAVVGIFVGQVVVGAEEGVEGLGVGVVAQEDQAGAVGRDLGGEAVVGHLTGPEAVVHEDGEVGRHGDAGMKGIDGLLGVKPFCVRLVASHFGQDERVVGLGGGAGVSNLRVKAGGHPRDGAQEIEGEEEDGEDGAWGA